MENIKMGEKNDTEAIITKYIHELKETGSLSAVYGDKTEVEVIQEITSEAEKNPEILKIIQSEKPPFVKFEDGKWVVDSTPGEWR